MWAIRRSSAIALRFQTFSAVSSHASYTEHKISSSSHVDDIQFLKPSCGTRLLDRYYSYQHSQTTLNHHYSSIASRENSDEVDNSNEDSTKDQTEQKNVEDESDDDIISEPELSEDELDDFFIHKGKNKQKWFYSELFRAIMASPVNRVPKTLDRWLFKKGKTISRSDVSAAMLELRRRRMYDAALKLSEWLLKSGKLFKFNEKDYSSCIDLIAKTRGLNAAETYVETIPKSFQTEMMYHTLLANCVQSVDTIKAEKVFNKMKELKLSISSFACNQLLLLYKKTDKMKIADVITLMEKENVKLTLLTYLILVDSKGQSNDINGMEQVVEKMKAEGIDPDIKIQATLARHYINGGLTEKAKVILQEMEGNDLKKNRRVCSSLLPLYTTLQSVADVDRVWGACKFNSNLNDCTKAIFAYGKLKKVEAAKEVFDQMSKKFKSSSRLYAEMLKVYASNKMLSEGNDLVKEMEKSGCQVGPLTWDALVKLYVEAGEIEKACSVLPVGSGKNHEKPLFCTYFVILEHYAKRGDIHNAEKMFQRMRQDGYVKLKQYHCLLLAYKNANVYALGFRERMKTDNIIPSEALEEMLSQLDTLKTTAVSDMLN